MIRSFYNDEGTTAMPRTKQMKITGMTVRGESGTDYSITAHEDGSLWCSCPAMRFQTQGPGNKRLCKHIEFATATLAQHFANVRALEV